jgi:hypothetical protein
MQSLLELFSEQEEKFANVGARNFHKLKYVYDSTSSEVTDYDKMKFELHIIFKLIEALEPKQMRITIDDTYKKLEKLEFNPTISGPNIFFRDKLHRDFSVWYKPIFYVPTANSAKEIIVDFVVLRSVNLSMYTIDPELRKQLYAYEFLSDILLRDISMRLLNKLKHVHLLVMCKRKFSQSDLNEIKIANYYVKPNRVLLFSSEPFEDIFKMNLPINAECIEAVEDRKLSEVARRIF